MLQPQPNVELRPGSTPDMVTDKRHCADNAPPSGMASVLVDTVPSLSTDLPAPSLFVCTRHQAMTWIFHAVEPIGGYVFLVKTATDASITSLFDCTHRAEKQVSGCQGSM